MYCRYCGWRWPRAVYTATVRDVCRRRMCSAVSGVAVTVSPGPTASQVTSTHNSHTIHTVHRSFSVYVHPSDMFLALVICRPLCDHEKNTEDRLSECRSSLTSWTLPREFRISLVQCITAKGLMQALVYDTQCSKYTMFIIFYSSTFLIELMVVRYY